MVDPDSFTRHLMVVMLFGAARADSTPEQLVEIRDICLPLMRDKAVPFTEVVEALFNIMGPEWAPTGEWDAWLMKLYADWKTRHP